MLDGRCCHKECLGGCHDPNGPQSCLACRHYWHKGLCLPDCPGGTFRFEGWRCVTAKNCAKPYKYCNNSCLHNVLHGRECLAECPPGYIQNGTSIICTRCDGPCPKVCQGSVEINSLNSAQDLQGCTVIDGNLTINIRGGNIAAELEANLGLIDTVTGYVKIKQSPTLVTLSFLKNLRVIRGDTLDEGNYSFYVMNNQNLQQTWDWNKHNLTILRGKLYFAFNPKLCMSDIRQMENVTGTRGRQEITDLNPKKNGDRVSCHSKILKFMYNDTTADTIELKWDHHNHRDLLSYSVYYKETLFQNVSEFDHQDVCGSRWMARDLEMKHGTRPLPSESNAPGIILRDLKPWTQYAIFVHALTIATSSNQGAISEIIYLRTQSRVPSMPLDLISTSNASSILLVKWRSPAYPNGDGVHYIVRWQQLLEDSELERLDYCNKALKPPHRQPSLGDPDHKENPNGTGRRAGGKNSRSAKCCTCPKTPAQLQEADEVLFQQKFENFLQNQMFTIRPFRRRRDMAGGIMDDGTYFPANESQPFDQPMRSRPKHTLFPVYDKVVHGSNQIVLENLRHFTAYRVQVHTCNHASHRFGCSAAAYVTARTLLSPEKDDILGRVKSSLVEKNTVHLTWQEPVNPNGLVVLYEVMYRHDDEPHEQLQCVSRLDYFEDDKGTNLRHLLPGRYTARLRATSLARNGSWTNPLHFNLPDHQKSSLMFVLPVTIVVVFILLGAFMVTFYFVKKRNDVSVPNGVLYASVNPEYFSTADVYIPDEWEVERENVRMQRELGQGTFGMVYEGMTRNIVWDEEETRVAIKTVNETASTRERYEFLNEASVMKSFNCHHVVRLLGVVSQSQPILVIMELMTRGDLKSYLRSLRSEAEEKLDSPSPSLQEMLQMAGEIADGMAYLNAKKFVHRDLAARNCMVAEDYAVKIGDFGMTRDIYETDYYRKGGKGLLPVRWMSPESLKDGVFTTHSDVWSFGMVLWEIATLAEQPYQGMSNEQVLKFVMDGGLLEKPTSCPQRLEQFIHLCWQYNPRLRPTFLEILDSLVDDLHPSFQEVSFYHSDENRAANREPFDLEDLESYPLDSPPLKTSPGMNKASRYCNFAASASPSDIDLPLRTHDTAELSSNSPNSLGCHSEGAAALPRLARPLVPDGSESSTMAARRRTVEPYARIDASLVAAASVGASSASSLPSASESKALGNKVLSYAHMNGGRKDGRTVPLPQSMSC
uniref:insulin-like growth factor 1 receptor n=1 Tax=Myxine glutinosa TaxID=7769 RepID=UPI00358E24DE